MTEDRVTYARHAAELNGLIFDIDDIVKCYGTKVTAAEKIAHKLIEKYGYRMDVRLPLPTEPGSVIKYHNRQDSEMIAALDNKGVWKMLCIASPGHIHTFDDYTPEMLAFDIGTAIWRLVK